MKQHLLALGCGPLITLARERVKDMKLLVVGSKHLREHLDAVTNVQGPEIGQVRLDRVVTAAV
ncbi:hypothetical protein ABIF90_007296 [Bradyrhizobium japonicum]